MGVLSDEEPDVNFLRNYLSVDKIFLRKAQSHLL